MDTPPDRISELKCHDFLLVIELRIVVTAVQLAAPVTVAPARPGSTTCRPAQPRKKEKCSEAYGLTNFIPSIDCTLSPTPKLISKRFDPGSFRLYQPSKCHCMPWAAEVHRWKSAL